MMHRWKWSGRVRRCRDCTWEVVIDVARFKRVLLFPDGTRRDLGDGEAMPSCPGAEGREEVRDAG